MKLGLRIKRGKWHVAMPLYDLRVCPECGTIVQGWPGQWQHDEYFHAPEDEPEPDPGGYVVGGVMTPAQAEELYRSDEE